MAFCEDSWGPGIVIHERHATLVHPKVIFGESNRVMGWHVNLKCGRIFAVCAYLPQALLSEAFYNEVLCELETMIIRELHEGETLYVSLDANCTVGARQETDHPLVVGDSLRGLRNHRGTLFVALCERLELAIANSFFEAGSQHTFSGAGESHIDYFLCKSKDFSKSRSFRILDTAATGTGHRMLVLALTGRQIVPWMPPGGSREAPRKPPGGLPEAFKKHEWLVLATVHPQKRPEATKTMQLL